MESKQIWICVALNFIINIQIASVLTRVPQWGIHQKSTDHLTIHLEIIQEQLQLKHVEFYTWTWAGISSQ